MEIAIDDKNESEYGIYISATCGKKSAFISVYNDGTLQVCCNNASHKAWGGLGKYFKDADDALNNYKSSEMKAMINAAVSEATEEETKTLH